MLWITSKSSEVWFLPSSTNSVDHRIQLLTVFVVGHTDCGGVIASVDATKRPDGGIINGQIVAVEGFPAGAPINRWLEPLTRVAISLKLSGITTNNTAVSVLTQENVVRQCERLCETEVMMKAWQAGQKITVYGRIFDVAREEFQDWIYRRDPPAAQ